MSSSEDSSSSVEISIAKVNKASLALSIKASAISSSNSSTELRDSIELFEILSNESKPSSIKIWARSSSTSRYSFRESETFIDAESSSSASLSITFSFQPVIWLHNLTFWPFFPIAWAKDSLATATSIVWLSSSKTIAPISAGPIAFINSLAGSSSQITISSLSLPSSADTACTLEPLIPTQAPTGSIR